MAEKSIQRQTEIITEEIADFNNGMGTNIMVNWSADGKSCIIDDIIEEEDREQIAEELTNLGIDSDQIEEKDVSLVIQLR